MIIVHYTQKGTPFVIASDLHRELEVDTPLDVWFSKIIEYGFIDSEDYFQYVEKKENSKGEEMSRLNWSVRIEMAKVIAILQKSSKGKALREYLLDLERQRSQGELLTRQQTMALVEITKVLGLFSIQEYLEREHYDTFTIKNRPNAWWSYRAALFGFTTEQLKEMVEALGKKYRNQRQALFHIDRYELINMATVDLFIAMGKSEVYAKNVGQTSEELAKAMGIEIYNDTGLSHKSGQAS